MMDEINKLLNLMEFDLDGMLSAMVENMVENMKEKAEKEYPDIPGSFWNSFRDKFRKDLDNESESLHNLLVDIYKRHFTREEIAGLIKFYESPLGRKLNKDNQQITQEIQAKSVTYFDSLAKEVIEELIEEDS